jgi:hypothetical protein
MITLKYKGGKQAQVKYGSNGEKGCYLSKNVAMIFFELLFFLCRG